MSIRIYFYYFRIAVAFLFYNLLYLNNILVYYQCLRGSGGKIYFSIFNKIPGASALKKGTGAQREIPFHGYQYC